MTQPTPQTKELPKKPAPRRMPTTRKIAISIGFVALGVVLSPLANIPIGPIRAYPFQHMINVLAAVMLGPLYAAIIATIIGILRNTIGTGTFFAFPGGIPGGIVVGLLYWYVKKTDWMALTENIGTVVIGATIGYYVAAPLTARQLILGFIPIGPPMPFVFGGSVIIPPGMLALWVAFAVSCIPGSILGFIVLKALRRAGIVTT